MVKRARKKSGGAAPAPANQIVKAPGSNLMAGGRTSSPAPSGSSSGTTPSGTIAPDDLTVLASSDGGRWDQFPSFGQIGRTGLLAQSGSGFLVGGQNAMRVFNPDRISIAEYDEMSLYPVIRSCLLGYALVMQTAELSVSCPDASMKALIEKVLIPRLPQLLRETIMPAQIFGWADAETVWETLYNVPVDLPPDPLNTTEGPDPGDMPQRIVPYVTAIKDFVPLANNTVTLRQTAKGEFAGAVQWAWGQAFLPPSRLFHLPLGGMFRNPYGQSLIKTCYPFWTWARFLWEMSMVAVERGAAPPLIGRYPASLRIAAGVDASGRPVTQDAGDFLLSQLTQLRSFATAVFPRQLDPNGNDLYEVEELQLDAHVDWMTQIIELCQQQMMLGLFFPDKLMQSGDVGSYALAKEHTDLFSLAVKARLDEFLFHLNMGPVKQFVRFNDRKCPDATITYSAPNIEAMQAFAMAAVQAMTTGQCLVGQNQDKILVPDWQGWADDLGLKYDIVRKTDGLDAFGRPLQPGADPDQQDHDGAVAAGLASDDGSQGNNGQGGASGGFKSGDVPGTGQGASSINGPNGSALPGNNLPGVGSDPNSPAAQAYARDLTAHLSDVPGKKAVTLAEPGVPPPLGLNDASILSSMKANPQTALGVLTQAHGGTTGNAVSHVNKMISGNLLYQSKPAGANKPALYAPTPHGEQQLAAHEALKTQVLSHLQQNGLSQYPAIKDAMPVTPSAAIAHLAKEGHIQGDATTGWQISPQGQQHLADATGSTPLPEPEEKPEEAIKPELLHPSIASVLQHVAENGSQTNHDFLQAGLTGATSAYDAGHIALAGHDQNGWTQYDITKTGQSALAGHQAALKQAQEAAPAQEAAAASSPTSPTGGYVTLPTGKIPLNGRKTSLPATEADIGPMVKKLDIHPNAKKLLSDVVAKGTGDYADPDVKNPFLTKGQLGATLAIANAYKKADGHNKLLVGHVKSALAAGAGTGVAGGDITGFKSAHPDIAAHLGDHEEPKQEEPKQEEPKQEKTADELFGKTEEPETAAPTLPEGWKTVSTKADKGYKLTSGENTAVVKPAPGGKFQLAVTDGRDINIHPETFASKEEAFDQAHKTLGITESESGQAEPPSASQSAPAAAPVPDGLTPGQAALYSHIHANPGAKYDDLVAAHETGTGSPIGTSDALEALKDAGHVTEQGPTDAGGNLSPDASLDDMTYHPGTPHAPASDVKLPEGWTKTIGGHFHFDNGNGTGAQVMKIGGKFVADSPTDLENPFEDAPTKTFDDPQQAVDWAHKQASRTPKSETGGENEASNNEASNNEASNEVSGPASPLGFTSSPGSPATEDDIKAAVKGTNIHPNAKQKLIDAELTKGQLSGVVAQAVKNKQDAGHEKLLPKHVGDALNSLANSGDMDKTVAAPSPPAPASPVPSPPPSASQSPAQPEPTKQEAKFVTVNGEKKDAGDQTPLTNTVTNDAIDKLGLSDKAKKALLDAHSSGKISTVGDLHQALAIAEAANKSSGFKNISGYSMNAALTHGTVANLKSAAEADPDSEAAKHAANLGDSNILGPQAQKKADFDNLTADQLMHQKTGNQAGSNPGGFYKTSSGDDVYVKQPADPQQAHGEHAANAIYSALGVAAPQSTVATGKVGKVVYASKLIDHDGTLGSKTITPELAKKALGGFAGDVLLSNWDSLGTGGSNMVAAKDGSVARIDNGGAGLFRAQGDKKPDHLLDKISEWRGFANPSVAPDYAGLFKKAGYSSADEIPGIEGQISKIEQVRDKAGGWDNFLKQSAPGMDDAHRQKLASVLEKRTALLSDQKKAILTAKHGQYEATKASYKEHQSDAEGTSWADKHFAQQVKEATPKEKEAAKTWQSSYYHTLNKPLYAQEPEHQWPAKTKETVKHLDAVFAKPSAIIKEPVVLHRGFSLNKPEEAGKKAQYESHQPGDQFQVDGYQAASVGTSAAFSHNDFNVKVHVPAGAKALHVDGLAGGIGEREVLLPRNQKYRVLSNEKSGSKHVQHWEMIVPGMND